MKKLSQLQDMKDEKRRQERESKERAREEKKALIEENKVKKRLKKNEEDIQKKSVAQGSGTRQTKAKSKVSNN